MRVLVTGGAGYVGSVVAREVVRAGHEVVVYDDLVRGHRQAIPQGAEIVVGSLADRAALTDLLRARRFDAVLHFAALIEAGESMTAPARYFENNVTGSLALLDAMVAHGVERLVFSSTAGVYGDGNGQPLDEDAPLRPTNPYGESKLMVERMLDWFGRAHGLRTASLRYFNAAGADGDLGEDHRPESHLIPRVLDVALGRDERVGIFGTDYPTPDGTCVRDYVHVTDLASAHLLALDALEHRERMTYNLGSGRGFSVREVVEIARQVTGRSIPVVEMPRRPGDAAFLVANPERIERDLGWTRRHAGLDAIVDSAWQWRLPRPAGYEEPP